MRRLLALPAVLLAVLACAAPAFGHAAYVGSEPAPGQRLEASPARVVLVFTEPLNARLARANLRPPGGRARRPRRPAPGGPAVAASVQVDENRRKLVVTPARELPAGAFRVDWHTVS